MNMSRAILLVNRNIRLVETIYEVDPPPGSQAKPAARTLFKTLDPGIKVDDLVLVPTSTRYHASVNKVVRADVVLDDYDGGAEIRWLIDKVDKSAYDRSVAMEQQAFGIMREAERKSKEAELMKKLMESNPELRNSAIAHASFAAIEGTVEPPPPPPPRAQSYNSGVDDGPQF